MKILLKYPTKKVQEPYFAEIVLRTGAKMNINKAKVDATYAEMTVDAPEEKCDEVIEQYRSRGVEATKLPLPIILDDEKCPHCGACVSVCPIDIFTLDENWKLSLKGEEECIQCGICIDACPFDALKLA